MILALPKEGALICQHFGHCEEFALYNIDSGELKIIKSPGHIPGQLPKFLKEQGTNVVIAGGMGERAQILFDSEGIEVIVGIKGEIEEAIKKYLNNELQSTGAVCKEHEHAGDCHS
ncbi:hypothetical protein SYNTR_1613 [Candidatus Syntrophocurvum alkaliphilum]|uniref:Dinitrogenase iron-molybdenum cofactor biosynthesis domain-containing protein n=1 Tax=Candidatus Syntrophocurvum alkaliphilum TaxID=2293317 RepID=A0A6I6DGI3_9FIRM|nr:NifB/NifX family molybdenum-iron cluster-binding protein [Candidatus Syntrophocurvum alkaliphilum]QGU00207.1 hypothetical protein SYNTR_1613 [Candidatus Syntrophocurvum alkaliphilum]